MKRTRHDAGFSLGELLLVIGISALLAGVAVPVASVVLNHHRLATVTDRLAFEVARARMQAVGQNAFVRVELLGKDRYARQRSTDGVTYVQDGGTVVLPDGFSIAAGQTGVPRFDRQGVAPASTSLTVSGPTGTRVMSISVLGRVTTS
jgi:Tfp pilus assembly protein FimT